jgi:hypothetical protein
VDFKIIGCSEWIKLAQISVQSDASVQTVIQFNYAIYMEETGNIMKISVSIGGFSQHSNGEPFQYRRREVPLLLFNT